MPSLDPVMVSGIGAALLGTVLFIVGLAASRREALRHRAGARVLLIILALIGLVIIGAGAFALTLSRV